MKNLLQTHLNQEFDRQVTNLLRKGYPKIAGIAKQEFLEYIEPLKKKLDRLSLQEMDVENGFLPFVIVISNTLLVSEKAMALVEKNGKNGVTILRPHTSQNFKTIDEIDVPKNMAYLLLNIDRGKESINIPPEKALKLIKSAKCSPLTIDEGIAIVTHFPEFLIKNNCFSLLASRTGNDKRVPAIWINTKKEPNLGWCWDGNPHTWLGSASAKSRIGH
jgi:hypothetical protein